MRRCHAILASTIFATGCAVSADGIGPAHRAPEANQVAQVKHQSEQNSTGTASAEVHPGILIIGTAGPLRIVKDVDRDRFYAAYQQAAEQWHPGLPPAMDTAAFREKLAGWASLQTFGIPGLVNMRVIVLVPA